MDKCPSQSNGETTSNAASNIYPLSNSLQNATSQRVEIPQLTMQDAAKTLCVRLIQFATALDANMIFLLIKILPIP